MWALSKLFVTKLHKRLPTVCTSPVVNDTQHLYCLAMIGRYAVSSYNAFVLMDW